jgi:hypothetical protein
MSDDDRYYRDRIRESNEYLDRRYDERISEEVQAARSNEVWSAIQNNDPAQARWALGIPPPDTSPEASDPPRIRAGAGSAETTTEWPPRPFVETLAELVENVQEAPRWAEFHVESPDRDGDVLVRATVFTLLSPDNFQAIFRDAPLRQELGTFWVRACWLGTLSSAATTVERLCNLIRELPDP